MIDFFITIEGLEKLRNELFDLKNVQRPAIIEAVAEAREHGDLKENAEYHAAREKQGMIEATISDYEDKLSRAKAIDISTLSGSTVRFGAKVTLENLDNEKIVKYQIVSEYEANIEDGLISDRSPVAKALLGKEQGDDIEIQTPGGIVDYEILEVKF
jgi:transcription elongation factor GreA